MQFIPDGPDLPELLLKAHEDGRVVFFCGAGISYPANLPGFGGFVQGLYRELGEVPAASFNAVEAAAFARQQYDTVIGLLENRLGDRQMVRQHIASILSPDYTSAASTQTHEALLELARNRKGAYRLVTTNFDRVFEKVIFDKGLTDVTRHFAPMLPIPKSQWNSVVYLHGLLPQVPTPKDLECLVMSSGDFGLAYINERWAARFVSELFRNYTVCFVGYSLSDPVLRYMMDSLAADRLRGEAPVEAFAFGGYKDDSDKENVINEWRAKNVTPIVYLEDPSGNHQNLHKTFHTWAEVYRDGILGKESLVTQHASRPPLGSTTQDNYIGRVLWALSDRSGLPARQFADLNPVPPIEWLEPLFENRYNHHELIRFGVVPNEIVDPDLNFSVLRRPTPYNLSPKMGLVRAHNSEWQWDAVMFHLARWVIRHLNDPLLVLQVSKDGGIHPRLIGLIQARIADIEQCERDNNVLRLSKLQEGAPNAIPSLPMRVLWRLILAGYVKSRDRRHGAHQWRARLNLEGLNMPLRAELREILRPRLTLRKPFYIGQDGEPRVDQPKNIREIVDWDIVLSSEYGGNVLNSMASKNSEKWTEALPDLLGDFTALLKDTCQLMYELNGISSEHDHSYIHHPSIAKHSQNRGHRDWTVLIGLNRDAWLAAAEADPQKAKRTAEEWWATPYPIFKRLSFFAGAQNELFEMQIILDWLGEDKSRWLWSDETRVESIRLLVATSLRSNSEQLSKIEDLILAGPPLENFDIDIHSDSNEIKEFIDKSVWLRLAKLKVFGINLSESASERLEGITSAHPEWFTSQDERDIFPYWMGEVQWGSKVVGSPKAIKDLIDWLLKNPYPDIRQEDDWFKRCRGDFRAAASALIVLVRRDHWIPGRWPAAFSAWSEELLVLRSWRWIAHTLESIPDEILKELAQSIGLWLKAVAKVVSDEDPKFFKLASKILDASQEASTPISDDSMFQVANHPVGIITESLLNWWYSKPLTDEQGLPDILKGMFSRIANTGVIGFREGRSLLASNVITLFRVDRKWTEDHLLPLFDWEASHDEALSAWKGFLWSPRLYPPLMQILKPHFLNVVSYYNELGKSGEQYAATLTFIALESKDVFDFPELAKATYALPKEALVIVAQELARGIESSGDQKSEFWKNRILPYIKNVWPKNQLAISKEISEQFARIVLASGDAFPEAVAELKRWLKGIGNPDYAVQMLSEQTALCTAHPGSALDFLDILLENGIDFVPPELDEALEVIGTAAPTLRQDSRFRKIKELIRSYR